MGSKFTSSTSTLALASPGQWCGMETTPSSMVSVTLAFMLMLPLAELMTTASPCAMPRSLASAGLISASGSGISLRNLSMAVRTVLDGGTWFPPDLAGAVLRTSTSVELSAQEKRALVLYASGLTLEMVARRMDITPNTVKHYLDRVRDKYTAAGISARTKVQLNHVARSEGLLP